MILFSGRPRRLFFFQVELGRASLVFFYPTFFVGLSDFFYLTMIKKNFLVFFPSFFRNSIHPFPSFFFFQFLVLFFIMAFSLKKIWSEHGIGALIMFALVCYGIYLFAGYLGSKGMIGSESNAGMQSQYKGGDGGYQTGAVRPAEPLGMNEVFASANGAQTSMPGLPSSCNKTAISNPAELLPRDTNSQWAQLNPQGKGALANINLLKAGYHIGIDTVGQSMRNANLQERSEPPNPVLNTGPWNQSTISHDFMRPPLEIGSGSQ